MSAPKAEHAPPSAPLLSGPIKLLVAANRWYAIPVDQVEAFYRWLEFTESDDGTAHDGDDWKPLKYDGPPFDAYRLPCAISHYTWIEAGSADQDRTRRLERIIEVQHDTIEMRERESGSVESLVEALREIAEHVPDYAERDRFDAQLKAHKTCAECDKWEAMKHPLQRSCHRWHRILHARERPERDAITGQGFSMRSIARAALAKAGER